MTGGSDTAMMKRNPIALLVVLVLISTLVDARLTGRGLQQECSDDKRLCPDGSVMGRNPSNRCRFYTCSPIITVQPGDPKIWIAPLPDRGTETPCTQEGRLCADGSVLLPDPNRGCEFPECPACCDKKQVREVCLFGEPQCCQDGTWTCLNGGKYLCGGIETTNPNGKVCGEQEPVVVSQPSCVVETKTCPDGSVVTSDPNNGCELAACPEVTCCDQADSPPCGEGSSEAACCDDGTWACPTIDDGLELYLCSRKVHLERPSGTICATQTPTTTAEEIDETLAATTTEAPLTTQEAETSTISEALACTNDVQSCSDGSQVGRDPDSNCEFFSCPESSEPCCDPSSSNSCSIGARKCCNGQWICAFNAQGTFYQCDGVTNNPSGLVCNSGDPALGSPVTTTGSTVQDASATPESTSTAQDASSTAEVPLETTAGNTKGAPGQDEAKECPPDQQRCPDGTVVGRDPNNNCELSPCPVAKKTISSRRRKRNRRKWQKRKRNAALRPKRVNISKETRKAKKRIRRKHVRKKLIFLNSNL